MSGQETHPGVALLLAVELFRGLFDADAILVALSETTQGMSLVKQNWHGVSPEHLVFLAWHASHAVGRDKEKDLSLQSPPHEMIVHSLGFILQVLL